MSLKDYKNQKPKKLEKIDLWVLQKLSKTADKVKNLYENYNIAGAKKQAEAFFWHVFCDDYLEIIKNRIYQGDREEKLSAQYVLYQTLLSILKIISPIMPFITEEIYQDFFKEFEKQKSIHISNWPDLKVKEEKNIKDSGDLFMKILHDSRKLKSKRQKSVKAEIILYLEKEKFDKLKPFMQDLKAVANAKEIKQGKYKIELL